MNHEIAKSKTISLPNGIWDLVEQIANETGLSRSLIFQTLIIKKFGVYKTKTGFKAKKTNFKTLLIQNHE